MKKKRPYLLLELVIAFFLLSICALPLVRNPLQLLKQQYDAIERAELARLAAVDFADLKAVLNKSKKTGNIPWDQLCKSAERADKKEIVFDRQEELTISMIKPCKFLKKIHWGTVSAAKGKDGQELRLINFRITYQRLDPKGKEIDFNWRTIVTRPARIDPQNKASEQTKS